MSFLLIRSTSPVGLNQILIMSPVTRNSTHSPSFSLPSTNVSPWSTFLTVPLDSVPLPEMRLTLFFGFLPRLVPRFYYNNLKLLLRTTIQLFLVSFFPLLHFTKLNSPLLITPKPDRTTDFSSVLYLRRIWNSISFVYLNYKGIAVFWHHASF